jgi:hypothetical protein
MLFSALQRLEVTSQVLCTFSASFFNLQSFNPFHASTSHCRSLLVSCQCSAAFSLYPTSTADVTDTLEIKGGSETPSEVLKKISPIPYVSQKENSM